MTIQTSGTPAPNVSPKQLPQQDDYLLEHGQKYEIRMGGFKVRVPEYDSGGYPSFDVVGEIWARMYKHVIDQGGQVPFYYYMDYELLTTVHNGGYYDYLIKEARCQFIANSPFVWTAAIILALLVGLTIFVVGLGFTIFILKPAGEFGGGLGAVLIAIVVLIIIFLLISGGSLTGLFKSKGNGKKANNK